MRRSVLALSAVAAALVRCSSPQASAGPAAAPSAQAAAVEPPADPRALAVPGEAAAPCTSDAMCLNHRCNLAYGKCAFPCATDADCVPGTRCYASIISTCQPSTPGAAGK